MAIKRHLRTALNAMTSSEPRRFWTGQILALIGTVVAIYLAAHVGYEQALGYDQLLADQERFFLLCSMNDEVNDNLEIVDEIASKIATVSMPETLGNEALQGYVWDLMKESSETARIPSPILTGTRRFYLGVGDCLEGLRTRQKAPLYIKKQLEELAAAYRNDTLPRTQQEIERLRNVVAKGGLPTD